MVILITGISSGFGKAMAERLSSDGHKVYGTYRRETERIPGVKYIRAEITSDEEVAAAVHEVYDAEGRIDVFISNAGMGIGGPLEFNSIEDARRQMDVNWLGMVRCLHYVVPIMRRQRGGRIICISSIAGVMGLPFQGLYSSSKFAIEGYCEALRMELKTFGVDVVVVEPGDFSTGFTAQRRSVDDPEAYKAYESYSRALASIENDEQTGLKPAVLAAKISAIVRKRHPRYRYVVATFEQRLSVTLKAILPARLFAKILSSYYKM